MSDPFDFEFTPAPADIDARLSVDRIEAGLAAVMADEPDLLDMIRQGRLRWLLDGWDDHGLGRVTVTDDLGELVGTVEVHWSAVVDGGAKV